MHRQFMMAYHRSRHVTVYIFHVSIYLLWVQDIDDIIIVTNVWVFIPWQDYWFSSFFPSDFFPSYFKKKKINWSIDSMLYYPTYFKHFLMKFSFFLIIIIAMMVPYLWKSPSFNLTEIYLGMAMEETEEEVRELRHIW